MNEQSIQKLIHRWDQLGRAQKKEIGTYLRSQGLSYREIQQLIPVSKGTLSGWCRGVEFGEQQLESLRRRGAGNAASGRMQAASKLRARNDRRVQTIRTMAQQEAIALAMDPAWIAGVVAYWCEGAKDREVRFSNSDPVLILMFMNWAHSFLDIDRGRLTFTLHLHLGQNEEMIKRYWCGMACIEPEQFRKTQYKVPGSGHRKKRLYMGTIQVRIAKSGDVLHRIQGWISCLASSTGDPSVTLSDGPLAQR